ncbi:MAG: hypothetical protein H6617_11240 [Bdellovibrionaceae bacterium]|nr:hypothetical protein [Bdellovibrionales bacterium]MCB9255247.1 hypothetical protein [Pseudobdellovibrionaceae bacterium]
MRLSRGKIYYVLALALISSALWHTSIARADEGDEDQTELTPTPAPALPAPPSEVTEDQVKFYMGFPAFSGLVGTIAEVNQSMRDAAENPMDKWRRQNVQAALSKMPGAIRELANVFMSNELHNADLPPMQAMLGGFIDVNAADRYKKFLQHPDASLIPEAGPGFPLDLKAPPPTVTSAKIALSDPKFQLNKTSSASKPAINPSELADLSGVSAGSVSGASTISFNDDAPEQGTASSSSGASGARGLASVGSDTNKEAVSAGLGFISSAIGRLLGEDDTKKDAAAEPASAPAKPNDGNFLASVQKDLALLEGNYGSTEDKEDCVEGDEREECQEDGVFDLEAAKKKKTGPTRHKQGRGLRSAYKLKAQPKNWRALGAAFSLLPTVNKASARTSDFSDDQLIGLANATGLSEKARRDCAECEARLGVAACRNICAPRDNFVNAVRGVSGSNGGAPGSGGGAGAGGGGGRGAGGGSAIAAAAAIAGSVAGAIALVGTTAAQAGAAKSIATSKANEVVTNTKTKADAILHTAANDAAAKSAETDLIATLAKQKEQGKLFDTVTGIGAALAASASARAARLDQAYFNRGVEKAQAELLMYVQAGQAALTEYAMKASALVRGYVPNQLGPATLDPLGKNQTVVASTAPSSSTVLPGLTSPSFRSIASVSESPQSALERVTAAMRGSTRANPLRIPQPAPVVRAVASFEGTPHVSSAERARAVSSFGDSSRPTHTR